ncbi:MAG: hypothetical protein NZ741_06790 [Armatimonadetes bacterium]|nr:hypothetical protein [Armatimonadota bacterium]
MKVIGFDCDAVWEADRRFARELIEQFAEVEEGCVFDSLVRRERVPGSDGDALILPRSRESFSPPVRRRVCPSCLPEALTCFTTSLPPFVVAHFSALAARGSTHVLHD